MEIADAASLVPSARGATAEVVARRVLQRRQEFTDAAADANAEWSTVASVSAADHIRREPEDILLAQRASEQVAAVLPNYVRHQREYFAAPPASVAHARREVHREAAHLAAQDQWPEDAPVSRVRATPSLTFEWPARLADLPGELLREPLRFVPRYLRAPFEQHNLGRELLLHMQPAQSVEERARPERDADVWHPLGTFKRQMRRAGLALAADVARNGQYYTLEGRFLVSDAELKREDEFTDTEQMFRLRDRDQEVPDVHAAACDVRYREQRAAEELDARATERLLRSMDTDAQSRHFSSYLEDQTRVFTILQPHWDNVPLAQPTWKLLELDRLPVRPNRFRFVCYFVTMN